MCFAGNHALCDLNGLIEEKRAFPASLCVTRTAQNGTAIPSLIRVKECHPGHSCVSYRMFSYMLLAVTPVCCRASPVRITYWVADARRSE
jgi:hypothetical protein